MLGVLSMDDDPPHDEEQDEGDHDCTDDCDGYYDYIHVAVLIRSSSTCTKKHDEIKSRHFVMKMSLTNSASNSPSLQFLPVLREFRGVFLVTRDLFVFGQKISISRRSDLKLQ